MLLRRFLAGFIVLGLAALAVMYARMVSAQTLPDGLIINGSGQASITWTLPTTYVDGTTLDPAQRSGFVLFYGSGSRFSSGTTPRPECLDTSTPALQRPRSLTDAGCYPSRADIANGSVTSTQLTMSLTQATTIYFAAVTRSANGSWSAYSNETAKRFVLNVNDLRMPSAPVLQSIGVSMTCTTSRPTEFTCSFQVLDP